jgi:hypothetical protein
MFIQVGRVGNAQDDLLVEPVGGQVTKLLCSSVMTRIIWVGEEYGSFPQPVGAQLKEAYLFCEETNLF